MRLVTRVRGGGGGGGGGVSSSPGDASPTRAPAVGAFSTSVGVPETAWAALLPARTMRPTARSGEATPSAEAQMACQSTGGSTAAGSRTRPATTASSTSCSTNRRARSTDRVVSGNGGRVAAASGWGPASRGPCAGSGVRAESFSTNSTVGATAGSARDPDGFSVRTRHRVTAHGCRVQADPADDADRLRRSAPVTAYSSSRHAGGFVAAHGGVGSVVGAAAAVSLNGVGRSAVPAVTAGSGGAVPAASSGWMMSRR